MAKLLPWDAGKAIIGTVIGLYRKAEESLLRTLAEAVERGVASPHWSEGELLSVRRYRRHAEKVVADTTTEAHHVVDDVIGAGTMRGAAHAVADLAELMRVPIGEVDVEGAFRDTRPLVALAREMHGVIDQTGWTVLRSTDDIYRRVIADVMSGPILGTETRRDAAIRALDRFAAAGITGFIDKAGRRWEMCSYVEMATRSAAMNAALLGHADRLLANGHDLVIVSDVPQECAGCRPWEGAVLSLTGKTVGTITGTQGVRVAGTLAEARAAGLFHPGCRHSIAGYQPGITRSFGETADPAGDKARQKLRALERAVRAAKREELVALDQAAKRQARAKVRAGQAAIRQHVASTAAKRQPHREQITGEYRPIDLTT